MWELTNRTPFAADRTVTRDLDGAELWVVAVKAAFDIHRDGTTAVSDKQLEVLHLPQYVGPPGRSGLVYDLDMIPGKPTTDVLVNGCAHAARPSLFVDVGMSVGPVRKVLRVFGDRVWRKTSTGPKIGDPVPFERLPIMYERAFGGADPVVTDPARLPCEGRNPVGAGFATRPEWLENRPLPNVERQDSLISSWKDRPEPAGFSALPPQWLPRASLAGTYDRAWEEERFPLLPLDLNERFFQSAPLDQQTPKPLHGGEAVLLRNLTPDGLLQFSLPSIVLGFRTVIGNESIEHRGKLHTVIVEPEFPRVILIWHAALRCHGRSVKVRGSTIWIKPRVKAMVDQA